jgi:hypothetical protein
MVALQGEVALARQAVVRPHGELARLDLRLPVRTPELILQEFEAVEPVLDVRAPGDDPRGVPVADGLEMSRGRRIEAIRCPRTGQAGLVVGSLDVVEQLVLDRKSVV